jgi:hypothetical protein
MDSIFKIVLFQREINSKLIFSLAVKMVFTQVTTRFFNNEIEKFIEKQLKSEKITSVYKKKLLRNLQNNFTLVKRAIYCTILGLSMVINLEEAINNVLNILKLLSNLVFPKDPKEKIEIKLPEVFKIRLENLPQMVNPEINLPVKVPEAVNSLKDKRVCELFERYIFTQKELLKSFEKAERISIKERLTTYCTSKVSRAVKRVINVLSNEPVALSLRVVKNESDKVLLAINNLPPDSSKAMSLTKEFLFTLRCMDSYTDIFKKETTVENLNYFKQKILPDIFVILVNIQNEAKK